MFLKGKHILKNNKKKWILLLSIVLIFAITATVAYMVVPTDEYDYTMSSAAVTIQPIVVKDANNIPTTIIAKNVGNADARVRVQIVPMYRNVSNGSIFWKSPVLGTDFSLECASPWQALNDTANGATYYNYYYDALLAVGQQSTNVLSANGIKQITDPPKGFALYFDVLFDAVQKVPDDKPAYDAWGVTGFND